MPVSLKSERILFVTTLGLVLVGTIMVFSSSVVMANESFGDANYFLFRHLVAVGLGLAGMYGVMQVSYHHYRNPAIVFSLLSVAITLLGVAYFMPATANTHRWIRVAGLSFQPAELAKLAVVLFLAWFLEKQQGRVHSVRETLVPAGVVVGVIGGLIVLQPDLGTAVAIVVVSALLLFSAGLEWKWLAFGVGMAIPAFYVFVYSVPWRWTRFSAFLDPWSDSLGSGYQIIQSLTSVGSGGVTGVGLMEGQQKLFFLPEPHTDFIFAVVGEELGMIGTLLVLGLFGVFTWRGLRTAMRAPDPLGSYLALGITMMVAVQAFFNMSVVLGMLPTKGIPLPFLSYGGSSFLIMLLGVGVLMNVSQQAE